MSELGYRDPMTYRKLPTIESLTLINHSFVLQQLYRQYDNVSVLQYLHELMEGKDPSKSDWFKKIEGKVYGDGRTSQ